jgi:adenine specific DNA methylase Mod
VEIKQLRRPIPLSENYIEARANNGDVVLDENGNSVTTLAGAFLLNRTADRKLA